MKKTFLPLNGTALLVFLLLLGCQSTENEDSNPLSEEEQESAQVRPEVTFAIADSQPIYQYIESQGVVQANRSVKLKPKVSGYIKESNIREGKHVQEGDTLLRFVQDERELAVKKARNNYKQSLSEYEIESRAQDAVEELENVRDDSLVRIFSGLAQAKVNLQRAKLKLSHTTLLAPFSGVLHTKERITPGAYVGAGTEVGQLVDDRTVRIRFDVLESELSKIDAGMDVRLTAPGGEQMQGTVEAVSPVVNTETKTGTVIVEADNPDGILTPGMTVEGRVQITRQEGKVRIPRSAILSRDGGRTLLFKLHPENNEVQWVYVEPTAQNSQWAIVNHEEIAPGDTIAVDHHFSLSHLQIVDPVLQVQE